MISTVIYPTCCSCKKAVMGTVVKTDLGEFCYKCVIEGRVQIILEPESTRWPEGAEL